MPDKTGQSTNGSVQVQPAAEFQALPLEYIVSAPLVAAVRAQSAVAETTRNFIESMLYEENGKKKPVVVEFTAALKDSEGADSTKKGQEVTISAPMLSIVPIPHLRIDSITTNFKYEISQTSKKSNEKEAEAKLNVKTGAALSPWVSASLEGRVSSKSSSESVMNRSGTLEITVHASEAPMPEGLAKVLGLLSSAIEVSKAK